MSQLVRPREITERKQSLRKDSNAKKFEVRREMAQVVSSRGYVHLKRLAASVLTGYHSTPGRTKEENESYLTYCTLLWAYNKLWTEAEAIAKIAPKEQEQDDNTGW